MKKRSSKMSKTLVRYGFIFKLFIIVSLSAVLLLKFGIKIDSLEFGGLNLERLYIKLDKKLIVRADNITLPVPKFADSGPKRSSEQLLNITQSAVWIDRLFEEISLKRVRVGENEIAINFSKNSFFVDSSYFGVDLRFNEQVEDGVDHFDVRDMRFKDFNITLSGTGSVDLKRKIYTFAGDFESFELRGKIDVEAMDDEIRYKAHDIEATSLKNFINDLDVKFGIDKEVKNWIYGYIIAQDYAVHELNGRVNLSKPDFFLNELNATATAKNLKVKFEKTLQAVDVAQANITLNSGKLSFELFKPVYKGRTLDGSGLEIYNIFGESRSGLRLNLKTKSLYDETINDILRAYKIDVPVSQIAGKMDATLMIDIGFDDGTVLANGRFRPKDARLKIAGADFGVKNADVKLMNSSLLEIDASGFGMDFFDTNAKAKVDLNTSIGDINGTINSLKIGAAGSEVLNFKDEKLKARLDFSGAQTKLDILEFGINFLFGDENIIQVQNGSNLLPYSPLLKGIGISELGRVIVRTRDFNRLDIEATDAKFSLPFMKKDGNAYEKDSFKFSVHNGQVQGKSASGAVEFSANERDVNITTTNLDLKFDTNSSDTSMSREQTIHLFAKNTNLMVLDLNRTLEFQSLEATQKSNSLIVNGLPKQGRFSLVKNGKNLNLDANEISGEFVNAIFGIKSFEGGKFRLKLVGKDDAFKAEARFHGAYLKDYVFYQQLLSFINSVPSLLSLKTPDFNDKGFTIDHGKILLEKNGDILKFLAIEIVGSSADIGGHGTIDLASKQINIDLELKILKDASSFIDKIPLVNHIVLGKDRSFSTLITLRGTMDSPKYSTRVIADTLLTPFKLIRNVLEVPFLIFE